MPETNLGRVAFKFKGDYSALTTYSKYDVVFNGESSFVSQIDGNIGNLLSDELKWKYLAKGNSIGLQNLEQEVATLETDLSETTDKITELEGKVEGNNIDVVRYSGESSNKGTPNVYNINLSFLNVGDKCKLKIEVVEDISLIYIFTRASLATLDVIDKIDYNTNNILAGEVREYEYTKSEDSNYLGICQSNGMGVSVKLEITVNSNDGGLIGKVNNTIINASQYLINGNVVYGDFGNIKEADVLWADGINGRLVNSSFDNFVMEYSIVSVTKGDNTIVYTKTFDDNGNVIKITINII